MAAEGQPRAIVWAKVFRASRPKICPRDLLRLECSRTRALRVALRSRTALRAARAQGDVRGVPSGVLRVRVCQRKDARCRRASRSRHAFERFGTRPDGPPGGRDASGPPEFRPRGGFVLGLRVREHRVEGGLRVRGARDLLRAGVPAQVLRRPSTDHRGTVERPGRTVTLERCDPDSEPPCWGAAYKVSAKHAKRVLELLETREKQYDAGSRSTSSTARWTEARRMSSSASSRGVSRHGRLLVKGRADVHRDARRGKLELAGRTSRRSRRERGADRRRRRSERPERRVPVQPVRRDTEHRGGRPARVRARGSGEGDHGGFGGSPS